MDRSDRWASGDGLGNRDQLGTELHPREIDVDKRAVVEQEGAHRGQEFSYYSLLFKVNAVVAEV